MDIKSLNFQANEVALRNHLTEKCPRCNSFDTKFCYYNNYSLNQPRHFCKTCRRYWTQGGICRNIPIGGSSYRRNRRGTETRLRASIDPSVPTFVRHRRRLRNTGSIAVSDGRGRGRMNPMGINFPNESSFGPMQLLSFNNNVVNVNNNVVAPMFGTFGPPPQPLTGGNAWPLENMLMTADPNEDMFLWGFDNGAGRSGSSNGSAGNGPPPPPPLFSYDVDIINDQWLHDQPEYTPSLPPAA